MRRQSLVCRLLSGTAGSAMLLAATGVQAQVPEPIQQPGQEQPALPADAAGPVPSEEAPAPADQAAGEQIVVTGTLIRGIAPVGTNVVSVGREDIVATGSTSANDLLANIPRSPAASTRCRRPISRTPA